MSSKNTHTPNNHKNIMLERVNMKIHAASFLKQLPILPTHFIGKILTLPSRSVYL